MKNELDKQPIDGELRRLCGLQLLVALFAAAQIGTSFRLWTPQSEFPQVPVIQGFVWPDFMAWLLLSGVGIAIVGQFVGACRGTASRWAALMFLLTTGGLLLEDQHRAQPWMIHYLWISVLILIGRPRRTLTLVLTLTASLYVYSAISKANLMFLEQHGQVILSGLFRSLSLDLDRIPEAIRRLLIAGFPVGECMIAVGLLIPRTRQLAAFVAMIMHGLLILTFSSRGLNHEWSVLLWNGFFLTQALLLWVIPERHRKSDQVISLTSPHRRDWIKRSMVVLLWSFPILRLTGHLDQWVGWSLYSPREVVVRDFLKEPPDQIDKEFPDFTSAPYQWIQGEAGPLAFVSDRWSIAELHVPLNPEPRIEFAVAWALCEKYDCWDQLTLVVERRDLMSTTERESEQFSGRAELEELSRQFHLPTQSNHRFLDGNELAQ